MPYARVDSTTRASSSPRPSKRLYDKVFLPALTLQELTNRVSFSGLGLGLIMHIPLFRPDERFEKWRYVPAPATIGNSSHFGRVGLPLSHNLAV